MFKTRTLTAVFTLSLFMFLSGCHNTKNQKIIADIAAHRIHLAKAETEDKTIYLKYGPYILEGDLGLPQEKSITKLALKPGKDKLKKPEKIEVLSAQWEAAVKNTAEEITPKESGKAVVVTSQDYEIALFRNPEGAIERLALSALPANIAPVKHLTDSEISSILYRSLTAELKKSELTGSKFLLPVTDVPLTPYIYADIKEQSISILELPMYYEYKNESSTISFSIDFLYHFIIKSHVFPLIKAPFTTTGRLLSRLVNTIAVPFSPSLEDDLPTPAPLDPKNTQTMDVPAFNAWLDEKINLETHKAKLNYFIDGKNFFPDFVLSAKAAKESIFIRVYLFNNDPYGIEIADMLKQLSASVDVRVLIDDLGIVLNQQKTNDYIAPSDFVIRKNIAGYLEEDSKINARTHPNMWMTFDHTKLYLIDRKKAYIGGMNIGNDYRYDWHDMMMSLEGPVVDKLLNDFYIDWTFSGVTGDFGALSRIVTSKHSRDFNAPEKGMIDVRILKTKPNFPEIYFAQLEAIKRSKKRIYIQNAYFANNAVVNELVKARARGVDVRVILPGENDISLMDKNNVIMANHLLENGIKVYIYDRMSHVKAAMYDDWACVGSANFDRMSLFINKELSLGISDKQTVEELNEKLFQKDFKDSRLLTAPIATSWTDYVLKSLANRF